MLRVPCHRRRVSVLVRCLRLPRRHHLLTASGKLRVNLLVVTSTLIQWCIQLVPELFFGLQARLQKLQELVLFHCAAAAATAAATISALIDGALFRIAQQQTVILSILHR